MTMDYETRRHERQWGPVDGGDGPYNGPRDGGGRWLPVLPAFERAPKQADMHTLCACGRRRGMHRWGDEACPNRLWNTGNGQPQFLEGPVFRLPVV
jgi:hypothetical protein